MKQLYFPVITLLVLMTCGFTAIAQNIGVSNVAITPDAQAILELRATNKGVLLPRMTSAQAATLATSLDAGDDGMIVYDTDLKQFKYWDGGTLAWIEMPTPATISGTTLDDAYDAGASGAGRTITGDAGAVRIIGTGATIALETDGDIQLTADDTWIGSSPSLQRLRFDDNVGGRIHVEDADLMIKEARYLGMDGSSPRIQFYDGAPGEIDIQDANIEIDAETWVGVGSSVERIEFQGSDNEINLMGVTGGVGIGTNAPDDNLHIYQSTNAGVGITIENPNTSSSSSTSLIFDYAGADYAGIYSRSENYSGAPDYLQIINNHGAGSVIEMVTNGGSRMRINDAGIVTLPTYSSGSSGLMVASTTGVLSKTDYSGNATDVLTGNGTWADVGTIISNDGDWTVSGNEIYNSNTANVGIGIAAPTMKLHVSGGNIGLQGSRALVIGGPDSNTPDATPDAQLVLDGAENAGYNLLNTKLLIRGLDNESIVKAISVVDEDNNELFFIQSQAVNNGQSYFRGNVGIGTTSPSNGLHVNMAEGPGAGFLGVGIGGGASGNSKIEVRGGTTPYFDFANDNAIDYDARMILTSDNQLAFEGANIGIANTNPQEALHVTGNVRVSSLGAGGNVQADGNGNLIISNDIPNNDAGYIWNQNSAYQPANFQISGDGEMDGGLTVGAGITVDDNNTNAGTIANGAIAFGNASGEGIGSRRTGGTNQYGLDFYTNSTNRLAINNVGNVGIGTNTPASVLQISTAQTGNVVKLHNPSLGNGSLVGHEFGKANSTNNMVEFRYNHVSDGNAANYVNLGLWGNANTLVVTGEGNVGIGVNNPGNELYVNYGGSGNRATAAIVGPGNAQWGNVFMLRTTGAGNDGASMVFRNKDSKNWIIGGEPTAGTPGFQIREDGGDGQFGSGFGTTRLHVSPGGNVSVGGTAPAVKFAVNGNGTNVYATDAWIENNMHVQGNETLTQGGRGRLRVGTAWGYAGLYTDGSSTGATNDLVLGSGSGQVRIGPDGGGQQLKVGNLEGTGNRPVYADASGVLRTGVAPDYTVASNLAYSFDDVGWTTGTSGDDTQSGSIGLGFNLRIFGNTYSNVYLGTNGYMLFGNGTYIGLGNNCLPSGTINSGSAALLFWWDDLICNSFQYRTVGTAPNRVFQARYDGYQYGNGGEIVDCMIMIHEGSDLIVVRYDDVGCCGDDAKGGGATFGLQGAGGASAQAIPVGCNAPLTDDNQGANASQFMSFRAPN